MVTSAPAADFCLRTCKKIKAPQLACIARKALLGARSYLVPDAIRTIMMCGRGGTGRRATLRSLWPKGRGSSSLLDRTIQSCGTSKIGSNIGQPRKGAPFCAVRAPLDPHCSQRPAKPAVRKPKSVKRRSKGTPDRRRRGTPFSDMMLVC